MNPNHHQPIKLSLSFLNTSLQRAVNALRAKSAPFDSHAAIQYVIDHDGVRYHAELQRFGSKKNPVHAFHTAMGVGISKICTGMGMRSTQFRSKDIHGQASRCRLWH